MFTKEKRKEKRKEVDKNKGKEIKFHEITSTTLLFTNYSINIFLHDTKELLIVYCT